MGLSTGFHSGKNSARGHVGMLVPEHQASRLSDSSRRSIQGQTHGWWKFQRFGKYEAHVHRPLSAALVCLFPVSIPGICRSSVFSCHVSEMRTLSTPKAARAVPVARRPICCATDAPETADRSAKDVRVGFKWNPAVSRWVKDDKLAGKVDASVVVTPKSGAAYTVRLSFARTVFCEYHC